MITRLGVAALLLCVIPIAGCKAPKPKSESMKASEFFSNDRLKAETFDDEPIEGTEYSVVLGGIWQTISKDKFKALTFPEQLELVCSKPEAVCRAETVTIGAMQDLVKIDDINTDEYKVDSWDSHSLHASYGPDKTAKAGSSNRCHHHVLTVNFESGSTLLSDVPTGEAGCEIFSETDTYRLARGNYYVDTSAKNNLDKPVKIAQ